MKFYRTSLAALLLVSSLAVAARAASNEIPSDPGYHAGLPLPDSKVCTYDLYLPPNYDAKSKDRFPVLIMLGFSNEGSRHWFDSLRLVDWSESNNAIVVIVNTTFADFVNTSSRSTQRDLTVMDHYMKMVDAIPQAHPNLRLLATLTNEWGSSCVWAVAARYPQKIAGIVLGPGLRVLNPDERLAPVDKNLSIAVLHLNPSAYLKAHPQTIGFFFNDNYEAWEERVGKILSSPTVGSHPMSRLSTADTMLSSRSLAPALTFLIDSASLTNTSLPKVEPDKFRASVVDRVNKAAALKDPEARFAGLDPFVHIPVFVKSPEGKQALATWTKAVYDAADKKEMYQRYRFLRNLCDFDPLFANEPEHTALKKKVAELQADPVVKSEISGEDELSAIRHSMSRAMGEGNVDALKDTVTDLDGLIAKHPKTNAAEDAATLKTMVQTEIGFMSRRRTRTTTGPANPAPSDVNGPAN